MILKILCCGDVVGTSGCHALIQQLQKLKENYSPDLIIVNGENSGSNGKGPSRDSLRLLLSAGIHVITGGNHSFYNRDIIEVYQASKNVLRPCNFPPETPGCGSVILSVPMSNGQEVSVGIINVQLRIFMRELLACPFRAVESIVNVMRNKTSVIIVDMHGEATSEKVSFAYHFDGKVSAIFGTHTHIQTADERILPKGTGYITDIGSTCALHSSLGVKVASTIKNFITQMPVKFEVDDVGPFCIGALYLEIDTVHGKTTKIERISLLSSL